MTADLSHTAFRHAALLVRAMRNCVHTTWSPIHERGEQQRPSAVYIHSFRGAV